MKIIFLDVDGVLNSYNYILDEELNNDLIKNLKKILDNTDAKIVLSSAWRLSKEYTNQLKRRLKLLGINESIIISQTPSLEYNYIGFNQNKSKNYLARQRYYEIKHWIDMRYLCEDNDTWIAIDDLDLNPYLSSQNFVHTDPYKGLEESYVDKCINLLNRIDVR